MTSEEKRSVHDQFRELVNMAPKELEHWLETDESKSVGVSDEGGESIGHASGRHIVSIKRTRKADLDDGQYRHMRKVVNYIKRHTAQRPSGDVTESRWRYSLMNWGHDPQK